MQVSLDTINLKPPTPGRWSTPVIIALFAHLLLIAALTWGVHWKDESQPVTFSAELWSPTVQKAAPKAVVPPPPPVKEPKLKPEPKPQPTPEPAPKTKPDTREADIAIAKAKKEKDAAEKKELALKKKAEEDERKKQAKELELAEKEKKKKKEKEREELAATQKALEDKFKQIVKEKDQEAALKKARDENMRRIMGQANATGEEGATGTALRSSGPSAGYAGRVNARVKPNVVWTEETIGNPAAEITVTTSSDGTITSSKLTRSSGNPQWDKAALAALIRTSVLPRDVDGRVPSPMTIVLRPKE